MSLGLAEAGGGGCDGPWQPRRGAQTEGEEGGGGGRGMTRAAGAEGGGGRSGDSLRGHGGGAGGRLVGIGMGIEMEMEMEMGTSKPTTWMVLFFFKVVYMIKTRISKRAFGLVV